MLETKEVNFNTAGRLHHSARMYGEIFVNGAKSRMRYGTYVSYKYILLLLDSYFSSNLNFFHWFSSQICHLDIHLSMICFILFFKYAR
jgi:hypothetical protein